MQLKGKIVEGYINRDHKLDVRGLSNIFFKNFGEDEVTVGLYTLKPYEETSFSIDGIAIEDPINISFSTAIAGKQRLYYRATKVTGIICS